MAGERRSGPLVPCLAVAVAIALAALAPPVAAEENAEYAGLSLSASPPVQGIGGTVTVRLAANFFGGCCYPLFAYDVVPELSVPEGLEVVSGPEPADMRRFEAPQGGLPAPAVFTYTLRSLEVGSYTLNATVATKNCGSQSARATVEFIKGAIFSDPRVLYPATVSLGESAVFSVGAYSGLAGVAVDGVELRCAVLGTGEAGQGLSAGDDGCLRPGGLRGSAVGLVRDPEEPTVWRGLLPPPKRTGVLAVWLLALDSTGNTTVSPVFTYRVADTPGVYRVAQAAPLLAGLCLALGIAGLFVIWRRRFGQGTVVDGAGLGLPGQRRAFDRGKPRPSSALLAVQVAAWAAAAILVAWAVAEGLLSAMGGYTGGG